MVLEHFKAALLEVERERVCFVILYLAVSYRNQCDLMSFCQKLDNDLIKPK